MAKWTNLERVWSSWNIFQLSSLKMLNFLTTFDKQFCASTKPGDYYDKFMVLSCPSLPPTLISNKKRTYLLTVQLREELATRVKKVKDESRHHPLTDVL